MTNQELSVLKNTIEQMASDAEDRGERDFCIRLTVDDAFALCKLKPVSPAAHGRWLQVDSTKCRCSHCDIIALIALYPHGDKNFCPNCGAKMDGDDADQGGE